MHASACRRVSSRFFLFIAILPETVHRGLLPGGDGVGSSSPVPLEAESSSPEIRERSGGVLTSCDLKWIDEQASLLYQNILHSRGAPSPEAAGFVRRENPPWNESNSAGLFLAGAAIRLTPPAGFNTVPLRQ